MYFDKDGDKIELTDDEIKYGRPCCCSKTVNKDQLHEKGNLYKVLSEYKIYRISKTILICLCPFRYYISSMGKR